MCGRYTLTFSKEDLMKKFFIDDFPDDFDLSYNIAPSQSVLAVVNGNGKRKAGYLKWGLVPGWAKSQKTWKPLINARAENLEEKASFNRLIHHKRTVLLADSFFEWQREGNSKQPYRFQLSNHKPFAFAGLWDRGGDGAACTIITTSANDIVSPVHSRMPVILTEEQQINDWLGNKPFSEIKHLLSPLANDEVIKYPVASYVNSPKNNSFECIKEIPLS